MSLRSISRTLYQRLAAAADADISETTLVSSSNTRINNPNGDEEDAASHESGQDPNKDLPSERVLFEFMRLAGEAITYIEARELWRDMRSTNNGSLPRFRDKMMQSSSKSLRRLPSKSLAAETAHTLSSTSHHTTAAANLNSTLRRDDTPNGEENDTRLDQATMDTLLNLTSDVSKLSDEELSLFCTDLASEIKAAYSIRHSSDKSEFKFCVGSMMFLWAASLGTIIASFFYPSNATLGKFSPALLVESFSLFAIELVWECILSWVVLKYNIKINYTRKLGNLLKVPKYFIGDFFPAYTSSAVSLTFALALNQTLFTLMFYRRSRERFAACAYVFLSQDRREDRPDTLIFQVTEDIMRFAVYFPFKLLVVDVVGSKALIFIPIAVNNIGDGLAEPVGVYWGRHKYSTTALYHKGKFFTSKFTRSYEGSACVLLTTFIVIAANYNAFNQTQFWITFSILPFLMTLAEAKAPHTNDGPFLALVGCGFLSAIFLLL